MTFDVCAVCGNYDAPYSCYECFRNRRLTSSASAETQVIWVDFILDEERR